MIDFHALTCREKDTFNFRTSFLIMQISTKFRLIILSSPSACRTSGASKNGDYCRTFLKHFPNLLKTAFRYTLWTLSIPMACIMYIYGMHKYPYLWYVYLFDEFFDKIFDNYFDKFFDEFLTVASFRIGVPSILFLNNLTKI